MKPLAGATVLDFSRVLAGPLATQILAELGAEVIKVEHPGGGDETRRFEPVLPGGESAYFFAVNRGKRSITLDLKSPRGQELARRLAADVDIVVENFLPGTMAGFGLDYPTLRAFNPRLVYVSSTGFGQTGPDARRAGYDTIFQAMSGIMALTGQPDGPPSKAGVPVSDMTSALWIVIGCLAGLHGAQATGHGTHVDLAMMDVQVSLLAITAARIFALDEDPVRVGSEHPGRVPSAAFACADGRWLHVSASDQHWFPLCAVLGLAELAADPALRHNRDRVDQRARVMAALRVAIAARERDELVAALRAARVPVGEVNTPRETLEGPYAAARELVGHFTHPVEGTFAALRTPVRLDGCAPPVHVPPTLGADTDAVLRDRLGLSAGELDELRSGGVL